VSIATDTRCVDSLEGSCTFVGTTHGRVVLLRQRADRSDLLPAEVVRSGTQGTAVRSLQSGRGALGSLGRAGLLGFLEEAEGKQRLVMLDGAKGGLPLGRLLLPQADAAAAFCAGGGYLHLLLRGPSPEILRVPLPRDLAR